MQYNTNNSIQHTVQKNCPVTNLLLHEARDFASMPVILHVFVIKRRCLYLSLSVSLTPPLRLLARSFAPEGGRGGRGGGREDPTAY